jgi:hypothetical protein
MVKLMEITKNEKNVCANNDSNDRPLKYCQRRETNLKVLQ